MLPKRIWAGFLALLALVALGYGGRTLYLLYDWQRLQERSLLTQISWSVQERSEENFILKDEYIFEMRGIPYSGLTLFRDKPYRNAWGAGQALLVNQAQSWRVWFDPANPSHSSLQKKFPLKNSIYATILLGIFLYFLFLYRWIKAKHPSKPTLKRNDHGSDCSTKPGPNR